MRRVLRPVPIIAGIALVAFAAPAAAQSAASTHRGHWGLGVGIRKFGGVVAWSFENSATPMAGTSGPYAGATLELAHDWIAPYVSFGYRGPVRPGSRVGIGIEGEFAAALQSPPDVQIVSKSPSNVAVTFSSAGGVDGFGEWGVDAHLSYLLAPSFYVYGGAAVSTLFVKSGSGGYVGSTPPTNGSFFFFAPPGPTPQYFVTTVVPRIGAEYAFARHAGLNVSADLVPAKTTRLTDTPVPQTFRRHDRSITASVRFVF